MPLINVGNVPNRYDALLAPYISKGRWRPSSCLRSQDPFSANQIFDVVLPRQGWRRPERNCCSLLGISEGPALDKYKCLDLEKSHDFCAEGRRSLSATSLEALDLAIFDAMIV
jgi:hypothetical protein